MFDLVLSWQDSTKGCLKDVSVTMRIIVLCLSGVLLLGSCRSPDQVSRIDTYVYRNAPDYPNALERMRSHIDGQPVMITVAGYPGLSADSGKGMSKQITNDTSYFDVIVERATVDTMELLDASVPPQKMLLPTRAVQRIDVLVDRPNRKSNRLSAIVAGLIVAAGVVVLLLSMSSVSPGSPGMGNVAVPVGLLLGGLVAYLIKTKGGKSEAYEDTDNPAQRSWLFK